MNRVPERGMRQKARILALIAKSPMSDYDLADKLHICLMMVRLYVRQMKAQRRVYVSGYEAQGRRIRSALYAAGDLPDAPMHPPKPHKPTMVERQLTAVVANMAAPISAVGLMAETGCARPTVLRYVNSLREQGKAHIASWSSSGRGEWTPMYVLGAGADAVKVPYDRRARAKELRQIATAAKKASRARFAASLGALQ